MSHVSYPVLADVQAAFVESGLGDVAPSDAALGGALAGAIATWKRDCDWSPFLAASEPSEKRFTLCNTATLFLRAGMVAAPESVFVDGVELILDSGYWLEPSCALDDGEPFTRVRFRFRRSSMIQGCVISARWGFCAALPDDVFRGIVALAAWNVCGEVQRRFSDARTSAASAAQVVKAKESGPLRVEFQTVDTTKVLDLGATFEAWRGQYDSGLVGRVMLSP